MKMTAKAISIIALISVLLIATLLTSCEKTDANLPENTNEVGNEVADGNTDGENDEGNKLDLTLSPEGMKGGGAENDALSDEEVLPPRNIDFVSAKIIDSTTIRVTFNTAINFDPSLNGCSASREGHMFVCDSPFPNPGVGGSWQVGVTSFTTTDNIVWTAKLSGPIESEEGVFRLCENCGEDGDTLFSPITALDDPSIVLNANAGGAIGFDVHFVALS